MSALWGLLAEYADEHALASAAARAHAAGYRRMDAYSPFPIEGLAETLGAPPTRLPQLVFLGGLLGGLGGYLLQYFVSVHFYPLNIGGRPLHSWPSFVPVAFELTILFAAAGAVFGMLAANGLPQPYHPVFNVPGFDRASRTGFFLAIESVDPLFDPAKTRDFLRQSGATEVSDVEP
jgi:hypothetical protein